ncbi:hypothetical protein LPJ71_000191 [Coemansia sp. S17]|nr:hypothetical protein LPJ71_000191 [Coemansia sp. S17]
MHLLSPFKILPLHIIELIVDYVAGSSRLEFDNVSKGSEEYAGLLMPLLDTCTSFWSPTLTRLFGVYKMRLSISGEYQTRPYWLQTYAKDTGLPVHLYVKDLTISVNVPDIYSGDALKELSCEPYVNCTFPKVRSIKFTFSMPSAEEQLAENMTASVAIESNISAFVRRIRLLTPMTKEIRITTLSHGFNQRQLPAQRLDNLVAQLSRCATNIDYEFYYQPVIIDQRQSGLCKLVYTTIDFNDGGEQIMELARRNASTLQLLDIDVDAIIDMAGLIQNVDGSYVQYPRLHAFKLAGPQGLDELQQPVFPGAVPFPNLRRLDIGYMYPFGDDTVFRGNAAILESLVLVPIPATVRVLREYKVFTPVSHPRLQCVKVQLDAESEPRLFDSDADYLRFVLSIGTNAPVRFLFGPLIRSGLRSVHLMLGEYTCIQVLHLGALCLNLWDVIALVSALPLLSDLHSSFSALGTRLNGVVKHALPAYVITNYALTGKRFRCWHLLIRTLDDIKNAVRCVLLLALVCPNFDYAAVVEMDCELFMAHMKEMITTDGFRPYAVRLRRLLFGGWRNEIRSVKTIQAAESEALVEGWSW